MQIVMLAAGLGKRLAKYTKNNTKCMVKVAGNRLVDYALKAAKNAKISRFVIVTGYQAENLTQYILKKYKNVFDFVFIKNEKYESTNNIYSFSLAKEELKKDDTILIESDIIFDEYLLKDLCDQKEKNIVVAAKYESWMDGTCVVLDKRNDVLRFVEKARFRYDCIQDYYKTVNIYKFSKEFLENTYIPYLETYIKKHGLNSYYEAPLKTICKLPHVSFKAFLMGNRCWYEIDDGQDLDIANVLFSRGEQKHRLIEKKYGGYWRYPNHIDFAYLVNPYFPPKEMIEKISYELPTLLTQYPSGLSVQNMNAGRLFNIDETNVIVGNGAAELINALGHLAKGKKVAVNLPTFNEYVRCFKESEIIEIDNSRDDYKLNVKRIKKAIDLSEFTIIVNPDNPSGFMLSKDQLLELAEYSRDKHNKLIIDESFVDFADKSLRFSLIDKSFMSKYPNIIVIKSISKSFGVPGLRLGLLITSDKKLLIDLKEEMQIWNINSFAEYYLQIYQLFAKDYSFACDKICEARKEFISNLKLIKEFTVYDSQANYVMVNTGKISSKKLAIALLDKYSLIIKDLSSKNKFKGKNFVRLAVRTKDDNEYLISCINELLKTN